MIDAGVHPNENVLKWNKLLASGGWWHSFELPDGRVLEGVNSVESLKNRIGQFPIPEDLTGKRVLDIGAWDGWFSLEMERRGASVVAIDCWDNERFRYLMRVFDSKIEYHIVDVYELTPERFGTFDIVLFMGVLYHLKHPLLGLEKALAMSHDFVAVDTFVKEDLASATPRMEFYETTEFGGQFDNWIGPNVAAMMAMCRTAGFARVDLLTRIEHSACAACYRKWEEPTDGSLAGPELTQVFHHVNFGTNFYSHRDEYATVVFQATEALTIDQVMPQVGPYGARPVSLARVGEEWYSNFKMPLGLMPGKHEVRVRLADTGWSRALPILIDVEPNSVGFRVQGIMDGKTWEQSTAHLKSADGSYGTVSIWMENMPENADRGNVVVNIDGAPAVVDFVESPAKPQKTQINARIPFYLEPGTFRVDVACGSVSAETYLTLI